MRKGKREVFVTEEGAVGERRPAEVAAPPARPTRRTCRPTSSRLGAGCGARPATPAPTGALREVLMAECVGVWRCV